MCTEIGEVIKAVAPAVTAVTAVIGAVIGIRAVNKWRFETIGRRRFELAEDVLASFYDARDRIIAIRAMAYAGEGEGRKALPDESVRERQDRDIAYGPLARYEKHREFFAILNAKRYRLRAILSEAVDAPFDDLRSATSEVRNTTQVLMAYAGRESARDRKQINLWRHALYWLVPIRIWKRDSIRALPPR